MVRSRRGALALAVATLAIGPLPIAAARASEPAPAHAMPEAEGLDLETLYGRGEARFHAGDLDGAIAAFSDGLERLGPEGDARLRAYFAVSLAIAHLDRHDASGDAADLERAHALLTATVEQNADTLRTEPQLEALARRNLDRARAEREPTVAFDPFAPLPTSSPETSAAEPPPAAVASPRPTDSARLARRRAGGIALLVSGTALVVGGLAVIIDGATLERRARAIAEDPPMGRQKEYIEYEVPRLQRIRYAIGAPALVLGAGLVVGGVLRLHALRRSEPRIVWSPHVGPRTAILSITGRF